MMSFNTQSNQTSRRVVSLRTLVVCAVIGLLPFAAQAQLSDGLVDCTYASLHAGTCVAATSDRIVAVTDARDINGDRCAAPGTGGGNEFVVCRYDGTQWSEIGASDVEMTPVLAGAAGDLVLDILNPPAGSGLTPPVGDGIDGKPNDPRTNDAPAINAAIQYACDNGYDVAYLGPGSFRIGKDVPASFYTGIQIDASLCPGGIKFYGAGIGQTMLLANGAAGQYIVFTTDEYFDDTKVHRIGWNTSGAMGDVVVTGFTTGVTPPVINASGDGFLEDGDTVHIRNCSGVLEANEQRFKVDACTDVAPFSCALQDEFGVDIDAQEWAAWNDDTACIVQKLNVDFSTEIAYMTLRDDDPREHMDIICAPLCFVPGEESHGIGILQSGGVVEVHDIVIDKVGDEGIDISAPESPTYVHDVTILNAEHGGTPVYQGVGIRIEDVWVHKDESSPWIDDQVGSTVYPPYSAGDAFAVFVGGHNWRVLDLHVNRMVATGELGLGFGLYSNSTGKQGQIVKGVKVTNSVVDLIPNELHCNGQFEVCGAFRVQVAVDGYPFEDVEISNNVMTGTGIMELQTGNGGILVKDNIFTPIPTITSKWGMIAGAISTRIEDNLIDGFERGCIQYTPYATNGGANASITTTIERNDLRCISNSFNRDPMIGPSGGTLASPAPEDEGYFHIRENQFVPPAVHHVRNAVKISASYKGVEICRNNVSFDPAADVPGATAISSASDDQLICDNTLLLKGSGISVTGDRTKVVGNFIGGFNDDFAAGILVSDSSEVLILNNYVVNYRHVNSKGIRVLAQTEAQAQIWIVENEVGSAGSAIEVDGNGFGIDEVSVSANQIDLAGFSPARGVFLIDTTDARVTANDMIGLSGASADALLTTGATDFIQVRDNSATGGGTLKYGLGAGDASCNPSGGVGLNSTCSGNDIQ